MVSAPDFDPSDHSTYRNPYQPERILNRATSLSFPIGELVAPLMAAHLLESGRIEAMAKPNLDAGASLQSGAGIRTTQQSEDLLVEDFLKNTSNRSLTKLALQIPIGEWQGIRDSLGLGMPLEIPGLTSGSMSDYRWRSEWTPVMHANPGQAIDTNLLQVLKAYLPIATAGYLRTPTMLTAQHGNRYAKRVLTAETAGEVRQALQHAIADRDAEVLALATGASVSGKSATLSGNFWVDPDTGKKQKISDKSVYIGMMPAEHPRWLVGVMLEYEHGKAPVSGQSTLRVFAKVAKDSMQSGAAN
ncbi:MAG: hypothetical protein IPG23_16950 [Burkholderiales bacterium]|nr:hypothetical protein [Burkholderiales bacterium]